MEARRTWVEAVSEAMTCDGRHLIQIALELRREVEEELPVEPWRKSLRIIEVSHQEMIPPKCMLLFVPFFIHTLYMCHGIVLYHCEIQ